MIFDPDSPPSFDTAELQHALTGQRDVAYVRRTAARTTPPRLRSLDRRRDPAWALLPVAVALCVVLALAAIGAGNVVLWTAEHWRGAAQAAFWCALAAWLGWVLLLRARGRQ